MRKLISILACTTLMACCAVHAFAAEAPSIYDIKSETAVLINAQTGQVLYDKDKDKKMYPASITKVLTGLLAMQNGDLGSTMTASYGAVHSLPRGTSHIALDMDETITLEQGIYAMSIESANDAANVIAEHIAGSMEQFAFLMNDYAAQLGAVSSHFVNAHGLPSPDHYTTAYDMALIAREAIKQPRFCDIFSTRRYDIPPTNKKNEMRQFWNANYFLSNQVLCDGIIMSKNGWTDESGHTLVSAAERDGVQLIAVVMNSAKKLDPYTDTVALFDYGFGSFEKTMVNAQGLLGSLPTDFTLEDGSVLSVESSNFIADELLALLPVGADLSGLSVELGQATIKDTGRLANIPAKILFTQGDRVTELGKTEITAIIKEPEELAPTGGGVVAMLVAAAKVMGRALKNLLMIFFALFGIWYLIRAGIIYTMRKKRRRQRILRRTSLAEGARMPSQQTRPATRQPRLTPAQQQQRQAQRLKSQIYKD